MHLDEKMINLLHAKKIARKRTYRLNTNEIAYINSLSIDDQIMLLKIEPMFVNYIKNQNDLHHNTIINMKGLEMGNLHLNNLNENDLKKLCKKSIKFARNYINKGFKDIDQMVLRKDNNMFDKILLVDKDLIKILLNKKSIYNFMHHFYSLKKTEQFSLKEMEELVIKKSAKKFANSVDLARRFYYTSNTKRLYLNFNYDNLNPQFLFFLHNGFSNMMKTFDMNSYYGKDNAKYIEEVLKKIEQSKNYDSAKLVLNMID